MPSTYASKRTAEPYIPKIIDSSIDHDFIAFNDKVKREPEEILYTILTSRMMTGTPEIFSLQKRSRILINIFWEGNNYGKDC